MTMELCLYGLTAQERWWPLVMPVFSAFNLNLKYI